MKLKVRTKKELITDKLTSGRYQSNEEIALEAGTTREYVEKVGCELRKQGRLLNDRRASKSTFPNAHALAQKYIDKDGKDSEEKEQAKASSGNDGSIKKETVLKAYALLSKHVPEMEIIQECKLTIPEFLGIKRDFLGLAGYEELEQIYRELKKDEDLSEFKILYKDMKSRGMRPKIFVTYLDDIDNIHEVWLQTKDFEEKVRDARQEEERLLGINKGLAERKETTEKAITSLDEQLKKKSEERGTKETLCTELDQRYTRMQNLISEREKSEEYTELVKGIESRADMAFIGKRPLLRLAIGAVMHAIGSNPSLFADVFATLQRPSGSEIIEKQKVISQAHWTAFQIAYDELRRITIQSAMSSVLNKGTAW